MNEFLHRFKISKFVSPLLNVGEGRKIHFTCLPTVLMYKQIKGKKMSELLERHPFHNIINHGYGGNSMLISWSRLRGFFDLALEITKDAEEFLRIEIKL